nr:outer membrane beta-barrel protein [Gracilimonas mengyeensis]
MPCKSLLAQSGKFTADVSYPVQAGDNFFSDFDGVVSFDLGYSYPLSSTLSLDGHAGYTYSKYSFYLNLEQKTKTKAHIIELMAGPALHLLMAEDVHFSPYLEAGYARADVSNDDFEGEINSNGINTEIGASFDFVGLEKIDIGLYASYQFIYLEKPEDFENVKHYRNMKWINFGVKTMYKF